AVGTTWPTIPAATQTALTAAFKRLVISNYAHNFDDFGGERFDIDPDVQVRGVDHIVQSNLVPTSGQPTKLAYRMRDSGGWKIIDVYYQGSVSELTTRRAEFGSILAKGGPTALVTHINSLADKLAA